MKVTYKKNEYEFNKGVTLLEISNSFKQDYKFDIILGKINNNIYELDQKVYEDCEVNFYDLTHHLGNKTYERGLVFLFITSVKEVLKSEVRIAHSIDKGVYCEFECIINEEDINKIKIKMKELVEKNINFEKQSISRINAIDYFEKINRKDKADLLKYVVRTSILLYKLNNVYDYFFGEMPLNTSYLKDFDLIYLNEKGASLLFPNIYMDGKIKNYEHPDKVYDAFKEHYEFSKYLNVRNIPDLNEIISFNKIEELIYVCEANQNKKLFDVAEYIKSNDKIKLILIGGPSSSGKTTTSKKLSIFLKSLGLKPKAISIDDFFLDRDETPKDENGKYDFESIRSVDIKLFNETLLKILNKQDTLIPTFNFIKGKKEYNKNLKLDENGILVIEGLHALNDELVTSIDSDNKYKIYISPLNVINIDNHNRMTTSDIRLLRRIIRDNMTRGYNASQTLESWRDVRRGEEKYVFPFQNKNDVVINTSLIYELGILRTYAEPLLFSVKQEDLGYNEAIRLINLIRNVLPINNLEIPYDSILREFIGNSCFLKIGDE